MVGLAVLSDLLFFVLEGWSRVGAAVVALAAAVVLAALFAGAVTRAIRGAGAAGSAIAAGDFERHLPEARRGVLGDLYRVLNRLAEAMRERLTEMETETAETETLLREMGEGVLALSAEGTVLRMNAALRDALGLTRPAEGRSLASLFRSRDLLEFLDPANVPAEGTEREFQVFNRTMLVSARRLPAGGAVAVFSDLTPIRRLERVRTEFVANASHELKTPLTAVRGYAETLIEPGVSDHDRETFARRIAEHAERMSAIVDDLLTLARLEDRGRRVRADAVPVRELAEWVWSGLGERTAGFELAVDVDPPDLAVTGDPEGVRQIIENLLDNAVRHSGGREVGVRARAREGGDVELVVWDRGRGIASAHLGRIFERFYRVDPSRSRASGGTGLGLSIVKHWAEAMGGTVWAESRVGEGAEIHVRLARATPAA